KALEVLLRTLSGYIAAPRATEAASLSHYDRIVVIPTLASERPALAAAPPPQRASAVSNVAMPPAEAFQPAPPYTPPAAEPAQDADQQQQDATNAVLTNENAVPPPARNATGYNPTFNRSNGAVEIARQGVVPGRNDAGGGAAVTVQPTPRMPFGGVS